MLKLLFGAGTANWNSKGYLNVDIRGINTVDVRCDLSKELPWKDDEIYEIYAQSILEHIPMGENYANTIRVLTEWNRVLRKDGLLTLKIPDLKALCEIYPTDPCLSISYLYGRQNYSENTHVAGFSLGSFYEIFSKSNFVFAGQNKLDDQPYEIEIIARKK